MADKLAPIIKNSFTAIGAGTTLYVLTQLYSLVSQYIHPSSLGRYLHSKDGDNGAWALVTGASDGIGNAFAEELCERGFNVVIHGRNASKLENVKRNLKSKYPKRHIQILVADASLTGAEAISQIERIARELDSLYLTVLVNNVGAGSGDRLYSKTLDRSLEEIAGMMAVNEGFPTLLTRALLPQFIQRQPALVINVGSCLGDWSCAYLTPYTGAKAHNKSFNLSLGTEMQREKHDVEFLHINVISVATPSSRNEASAMTVTPRTMARGALDRVGSGVDTTYGCLRHALIAIMLNLTSSPKKLSKQFSDVVSEKIVPISK